MRATVLSDAAAITWSLQIRVGLNDTNYVEAPPVFRVLAEMLRDHVPARGLLDLNAAGGIVGYIIDVTLDTANTTDGAIPPGLHPGNLRTKGLALVEKYGITPYVQHVSLHAHVSPPKKGKGADE